jgi:SEC-C motif-containing protein
MREISDCPCGAKNQFSVCCEPYIRAEHFPTTAEQLMRSRYSAYVVGAIDYLVATTHPSTRGNHKRKDIENWSKMTKWLGLEIVQATDTMVEFKANFEGEYNTIETHHEKSTFLCDGGKWFYVDGIFF